MPTRRQVLASLLPTAAAGCAAAPGTDPATTARPTTPPPETTHRGSTACSPVAVAVTYLAVTRLPDFDGDDYLPVSILDADQRRTFEDAVESEDPVMAEGDAIDDYDGDVVAYEGAYYRLDVRDGTATAVC
jgi:hypothetical protein